MTILPLTSGNTLFFIEQRGYKWSGDGQYLVKDQKHIYLDNRTNVYIYAEVDKHDRILKTAVITGLSC